VLAAVKNFAREELGSSIAMRWRCIPMSRTPDNLPRLRAEASLGVHERS